MDGVVTDTASVHAKAWKALFDEVLPTLVGPDAAPFDKTIDYRRYVDGRTREDGVLSFLDSRGVAIPMDGPPEALTVRSLAERKQEFFDKVLQTEGVAAFPDAVALLRRLRSQGIPTALVTSSRNSDRVLEAAGLTEFFPVSVNGIDAIELELPGKPEPAVFLEAARRLEVPPQRIAVLEDAESGVKAANDGGFGLVIGVDRVGHAEPLLAAGAHITVESLEHLDIASLDVSPGPEQLESDVGSDPWVLRYEGFDAASEGLRETLCTVGNGYWATRGAAPESRIDDVHYPGTYMAGVYNRVQSHLADRVVEDEHLVNAPNWLPLTFRFGDGPWFHPSSDDVVEYRQQLDLKVGILTRVVVIEDAQGRRTKVTSERFISQSRKHLACLTTTFEAENWTGSVSVRSGLEGRVANRNVSEYMLLADTHLAPVAQKQLDDESILLESMTSQSRVFIAMVARTRVFSDGEHLPLKPKLKTRPGMVRQEFTFGITPDTPVRVEKVVIAGTSRDRAIASPAYAAETWIDRVPDVAPLREAHERVWRNLWHDFAVSINSRTRQALALNLNAFHVLQTIAQTSLDLDAGIAARGLHGEGYRGHIFWDEMFVYPVVTMRRPEISRALLAYRYRRLREAKAAAIEAGHAGAMFPWQSGIDGREETPTQLYNLRNEQWMPDNSHRQRHVGLAIAYSVWEYFETTGDVAYLLDEGIELLVEISRFFVSTATYDREDDRYDISGVMGPDEFHDGFPGSDEPALKNNAYTNVLVAWMLGRTLDGLRRVELRRRHPLWERIRLDPDELDRWEHMRHRLRIPFLENGVIAQFEGYETLKEFDWERYRETYGNIGRMDLILHTEGDSTNNYKLSKQADALMLLYLFSFRELCELLEDLGYEFTPQHAQLMVDYYTQRSTHGSTLSNVVHSWVNARQDRGASWQFLTQALYSDLNDIQGGTTREGIHLGAMAGSIDMVVRCYTGLEFRDDAIWFDPALPNELTNVTFTIIYRNQPIRITVTQERLRLELEECDAKPITVHAPGETAVLNPGSEFEFALESRAGA